jgi:hypothetical protein
MTNARLVLRIDALTEAVLAAFAGVLAATHPRTGGWRLPEYLGAGVLAAIVVALLLVVAALWSLSSRYRRSILIAIGAANAVTAVAGIWYTAVVDAGGAVKVLVLAVTVALFALACAQALIATGPRSIHQRDITRAGRRAH